MTQFLEELQSIPGHNKTNVFFLLIAKLSRYTPIDSQDTLLVASLIRELKTCFLNHEQNFSNLRFIIKQNMGQYSGLSSRLRLFLTNVLATIDSDDFKKYYSQQTIKEALHCRLQRMLESQIAVSMLQRPSQKMWDSINNISQTIVHFLKKCPSEKYLKPFLRDLGPSEENKSMPYLPLAFGRFRETATLGEVISTLETKTNILRILLIHFLFMRDVYPLIPLTTPPPQLKEFGGDFADYLARNTDTDVRNFFWDYIEQAPHLYKDRGRDEFVCIPSRHLSITLAPEDRAEFPFTSAAWYPDCLCQKADLRSPYLTSLLSKDIPYVAGPSGMTSLFCGALLFLGKRNSIEEQQHYLLAIMAFITGGGLHSIHEVLTIPKIRLGLLSKYQVSGPLAGNYQSFFDMFYRDKIIPANLNRAWRNTIEWFCRNFPTLLNIPLPPIAKSPSKQVVCSIQ